MSRDLIGALLALQLDIAHRAIEAKSPQLAERIRLTEQTNALLRRS